MEHLLKSPSFVVAAVVFLGVSAQLIAQRLRLPSILLLLLFGFAVSPAGFDLFNPADAMGSALFPLISVAVAVILFEGGLTLKFHELSEIRWPLKLLISIGSIVTWVLTTLTAYFVLGFGFKISLLLGAILIVTGPTVIGPLLRHVRPTGRVASIVKWEGILNDPIGALIAVLVLEIILHADGSAISIVLGGVGLTLVVGTVLGVLGAYLLIFSMKNHWIPDHLQGITCLAVVLVSFVISNAIQHEAGLFTVTLMGILIVNQSYAPVKHLVEFKEHLVVLFISCLFIVLSARFTEVQLDAVGWRSIVFLAILIIVIRPASVFASTMKSEFTLNEKLFLSWMAPRGIVAAAVASLFALKITTDPSGLDPKLVADAEKLTPVMFVVIIGTVAIYGLTAAPIARMLGLASKSQQGVLIMGAHSWGRNISKILSTLGFKTILVDTNRRLILQAKIEELPAFLGNIVDEHTLDKIDLGGIGRMLALTSNEEANSLAAIHCSEEFGRGEVYQVRLKDIPVQKGAAVSPAHLSGRPLFRDGVTHSMISQRFEDGGSFAQVELTEENSYKNFMAKYDGKAWPFFVVQGEKLLICTMDKEIAPQIGQTVVALVPKIKEEAAKPSAPLEPKSDQELKESAVKPEEGESKGSQRFSL